MPLIFTQIKNRRVRLWTSLEIDGVSATYQGGGPGTLGSTSTSQVFSAQYQIGNYTGVTQYLKVIAKGLVSERKEIAPREIDLTTHGDEQRRELDLPPWFNSRFDGLNSVTARFVNLIREPLNHISATYRTWQPTQSQSNTIVHTLKPNRVFDIVAENNNRERTYEIFVLAVESVGGTNIIPTRTVHGIEVKEVEQAPLRVQISGVTDSTATVSVYLGVLDGNTVSIRVQDHEGYDQTQIRPANVDELTVNLTGLDSDTLYSVIVSHNAETVQDIFTTRDNIQLRLESFQINGVDVQGLNLNATSSQIVNYGINAITETITFSATGPAGSTIFLNTTSETVADGHSPDVLVTVSFGGDSRTYQFIVVISSSVVLSDIDVVSSHFQHVNDILGDGQNIWISGDPALDGGTEQIVQVEIGTNTATPIDVDVDGARPFRRFNGEMFTPFDGTNSAWGGSIISGQQFGTLGQFIIRNGEYTSNDSDPSISRSEDASVKGSEFWVLNKSAGIIGRYNMSDDASLNGTISLGNYTGAGGNLNRGYATTDTRVYICFVRISGGFRLGGVIEVWDTNGNRLSGEDFTFNQSLYPLAIWASGTHIYILDDEDKKAYLYENDGTYVGN